MKKGNKASNYYSACALSDGSAYNKFCEKHGKIIKQADYENLVHIIQRKFAQHAATSNGGIELPLGLGDIKVVGIVPKIPAIDHKNTKLYNKPIFMTNAHTQGVKYRYIWIYKYADVKFKNMVKFYNQELYIFKTSKYLKRLLKENILKHTDNRDQPPYPVVDSAKNYNVR